MSKQLKYIANKKYKLRLFNPETREYFAGWKKSNTEIHEGYNEGDILNLTPVWDPSPLAAQTWELFKSEVNSARESQKKLSGAILIVAKLEDLLSGEIKWPNYNENYGETFDHHQYYDGEQ